MDVEIAYRGWLKKPRFLETFEDRLVELAIELGGYTRIWRSAHEKTPHRVVRGVLLDLWPGLETLSLVLSPEGELISPDLISRVEQEPLAEAPWIRVNTQYGGVVAHVAVVALLDAMRAQFFPDLEVRDSGEYWERRDVALLRRKRGAVPKALVELTSGPERKRIEHEDAEDLKSLAQRVGGLTERVKRVLARPPEHAPVHFSDDDDSGDGTEAEWDAMYRHNERRQAGLMRAFEERMIGGDSSEHAFEESLRSEGIAGLPEIDGDDHEMPDWNKEIEFEEPDPESLPVRTGPAEEDRHPLLRRSSDLTSRAMKLPRRRKQPSLGGPLDPLMKGVLEISGGLAQAFGSYGDDEEEGYSMPKGQRLAQLKRALRGAVFARGSLFPARAAKLITDKDFRHILAEVEAIEHEMLAEVTRTRASM